MVGASRRTKGCKDSQLCHALPLLSHRAGNLSHHQAVSCHDAVATVYSPASAVPAGLSCCLQGPTPAIVSDSLAPSSSPAALQDSGQGPTELLRGAGRRRGRDWGCLPVGAEQAPKCAAARLGRWGCGLLLWGLRAQVVPFDVCTCKLLLA
jgi:hypothetical protein